MALCSTSVFLSLYVIFAIFGPSLAIIENIKRHNVYSVDEVKINQASFLVGKDQH